MTSKSSCTVRHTTFVLTPKYSCVNLFRMAAISRHLNFRMSLAHIARNLPRGFTDDF